MAVDIPAVVNDEPTLHIVLHEPEIPQNTGNIGRTCVALGAKLWLVRPLGFRLDEQRLRRAGLDYWEHLDWEVVNDWPSLVERVESERIWCFSKHGTRDYCDVAYQPADVLVFGGETRGLPNSVLELQRERVLRIPMAGPVRSLNLSNAVAVAGYELLRQTRDQSSLPQPPGS